jgi:hypothetical protein
MLRDIELCWSSVLFFAAVRTFKGDAHISGLNYFSSMDAHQIALFAQNLLTRPERLKRDSAQGQNW